MSSMRGLLALDPDKSRDYRMLPVIAGQASLLEEVLQDKSLENFTAAELKTIGLTYNEKSDYQNAKKSFLLALEKAKYKKLTSQEAASLVAHCQYGLANVERELGHDDEAIQRFMLAGKELQGLNQEAKEYGPLAYDIERNLGIAYLKVKAYREAAACFEKAINLALANQREGLLPAVTSYYGLALVLSGKHEEGFIQLDKARGLYPIETREKSMDWAAHRYHKGRAYQEVGDYINAISEFNESLRLRLQIIGPEIGSVYYNSRVGDTHAGLGQAYLALKQFSAAEKWLLKSLSNYQAVNNGKKVQEMEALLATFVKPAPLASPSTSLVTTLLKNKYLHYGLGASATLLGLGLFAYNLKGKTAPTPEKMLPKSFTP
jgi:tetratricopeptide (TPR) repeat protein